MRVIGFLLPALAVACTRDPVGECPELEPGDLIVTEVRGPQNPDDTLGVWIELQNISSGAVDLLGTKVRFRRVDGSTEVPIIVRRSLPVPAGGYVVLGLVDDVIDRPAHIDYGFAGDFHVGWLAAAAVDVETCGEQVDRARYDNLPKTGTYSFGGTPSPDNNDDLEMWCTNPTSEGTPGEMNPPCP